MMLLLHGAKTNRRALRPRQNEASRTDPKMQRLQAVNAHLQPSCASGDVEAVKWSGSSGSVTLRPRPGGVTPDDIIMVSRCSGPACSESDPGQALPGQALQQQSGQALPRALPDCCGHLACCGRRSRSFR